MADRLVCEDCGRDNFRSESGLAAHRRAKHPPEVEGYVTEQTRRAIGQAEHLDESDAGVVAVLITLARQIDGMPSRDPDAPLDNVTIPTYLKYSEALGLPAAARLKLPKKEIRGGGKLGQLRDTPTLRGIKGGRAS